MADFSGLEGRTVGQDDTTKQRTRSAEIVVFRIGLTTRHAGAAVGILQEPFSADQSRSLATDYFGLEGRTVGQDDTTEQ